MQGNDQLVPVAASLLVDILSAAATKQLLQPPKSHPATSSGFTQDGLELRLFVVEQPHPPCLLDTIQQGDKRERNPLAYRPSSSRPPNDPTIEFPRRWFSAHTPHDPVYPLQPDLATARPGPSAYVHVSVSVSIYTPTPTRAELGFAHDCICCRGETF